MTTTYTETAKLIFTADEKGYRRALSRMERETAKATAKMKEAFVKLTAVVGEGGVAVKALSLIHIPEPTRLGMEP